MRERAAEGPRQRVGRRLGVEPYYAITERGPGLLRLESRPDANRGPGRGIIGTGAALLAVAALVAVSALFAAGAGAGFATGALGAAVGGLLGALGYQRVLGGYAVATTRNRIVADAGAGELRLTQSSKIGRERGQALPLAQVRALRLRRRPLATGGPLRRVRPIVALELVADGDEVWIIDSAADPEQLRPVAEALAEVLGVGLAGA